MSLPRRSRTGLASLIAILLGLFAATSARANLGSYVFSEGTGERIDISGGSTTVFTGYDNCSVWTNIDDNSGAAVDIGFTFRYAGRDYTKFSVSTNGLIGLYRSWGTTGVSSCWTNLLASTSGGCTGSYGPTIDTVPEIAPWWDDLRLTSTCEGAPVDGLIHYSLLGEAPTRVLVIEFRDIEYDYRNERFMTMQTRLYEGSNAIEFWYGGVSSETFNGDGASVGLADVDGTTYVSVSAGPPASASTWSIDNYVDPRAVAANTLYTFVPCEIRITGTPIGESIPTYADGDDLFGGAEVRVGSEMTINPLTLSLGGSPCGSRTYSFSIDGPGTSEYTITPTDGTLEPGSTVVPVITYRPTCQGYRPATLTISGSDGTRRTFALGAIATPQIELVPDLAQGGTTALASGDTLLGSIVVMRNQPETFTPFTITNLNIDPSAPPASVSFELVDPNGQYTLSTTAATLAGGESITPSVTFLATGITFQEALLTVRTDCETRTWMLRAFSAAPAGEIHADGEVLGELSGVFGPGSSCVASESSIVPLEVVNTGYGPYIVDGVEIYRTDTMQIQGTPPYPLLRDGLGRLIGSSEYRLASTPSGAPLQLPMSVAQGSTRTIYAIFTGGEPGRRYARIFVRTNGQGIFGSDPNGASVEGLIGFNLLARAVGSQLASTPTGARIRPVVLPAVRLGQSSEMTFTVSNAGACDLLIRRDKLRITSGDVNEFALVSVLPATPVDAKANVYRIAPGASDVITVRFNPSRSGTRLATIMLQTNDSTINLPGLTERGTYRVDLHGFGRAGLDAASLVLPPVLVGGVVGGVAVLENSSNGLVEVRQVNIVGDDAPEFRASAGTPWPAMPAQVLPGSKLRLAVELLPTGEAGARRAVLEVITTTEDTVRVAITGEAGIAQLEVGPSVLFENVEIPVGQYLRRMVTITNNGTFPVRLGEPVITGTDVANYTLGALPRRDIDPGQSEFLEVTFHPEQEGASQAVLEIPTSLGIRSVQLGGSSLSAREPENPTDGVSGIDAVTGGARFEAIRPNPASGAAEIGVITTQGGTITVTMHDGLGRLVAAVARGHFDAGRHLIRLDTEGLANGVYHVRIAAPGVTTSTTLTVAR